MKHKTDLVMDCPGAWYGCNPGFIDAIPDKGHVIIDPKFTVQALAWLRKHRAKIMESDIKTMDDGGLLLPFQIPLVSWKPLPTYYSPITA